jgi:hypothetical protein
MTDRQKEIYFSVLKQKIKPPIIGSATIKGEVKEIEFYDESKLRELNIVRVCYRDEENRRCTSFINPTLLVKY